ncbi:MAG: hypothetical protein BMS9Abin06_0102 [Gammaproteobacteria bacterium]|nr:MAG: hypothetical protein BMS9Abin06_0102 [Gammaproteobacteria bacterium]
MSLSLRQSCLFQVMVYMLLLVFAAGVPVILVAENPIWIGHTSPKPGQLVFELLGFSGSIAILGAGAFEFWRRDDRSVKALLPLLIGMLVIFHSLSLVSEYSEKLWDYHCYEGAAQALLSEQNPYTNQTWWYQYPPLTAELMAMAYTGISSINTLLGTEMEVSERWDLLFYLFQFTQVILVILAYYLLYRFACRAGLSPVLAAIIVGGLLVISNPLIRTLRWSQINLWILDLTLAGILLRARYPVLAGTAIAIGAHLKIYPAIIAGPWLLTKQWRAVTAVIIGIIVILLFQTHGGQNWETWKQFVEFMPHFPPGTHFRDNSLHSIAHNLLSAFQWTTGYITAAYMTEALSGVLTIAVVAWFLKRFFNREQLYTGRPAAINRAGIQPEVFRHDGHAVDAIAFTVIAAPSVWEHHYILVLPVLLWAVAGWGRTHIVAITVGAILMFALPTFDVFPFSFHRVTGLLLVLWIIRSDPTGPPVFNVSVMEGRLPAGK